MAPEKDSCVVVGAGISGLLAASELRGAGWRVTVLEKSRGVGGRMATRRVGEGTFDHGAQFFTVRGERFDSLVEVWRGAGVVEEWSRGFAGPSGERNEDGHPRYRCAGGMTAIAKRLAAGLDVRTSSRAVSVEPAGPGWAVTAQDGSRTTASALVLTAPVPQSLALAESGGKPYALDEDARQMLEAVSYDPCLALLALLDGPSAVPEPGGVQIKGEPLDWVADNRLKGISNAPAVTVHAGPGWSREHFDLDEAEVTAKLLDLAAGWLGSRPTQTSLARWRYSWVTRSHPEPCLLASEEPPLVFCGDAFGQPKVEGAALSGLAAADALLGRESPG